MGVETKRTKWLDKQVGKLLVSAGEYPVETTAALGLMLGGGPKAFQFGTQNPTHGHALWLSHYPGRGEQYKNETDWNFKWTKDNPQSDFEVKLLAGTALQGVAEQFLLAGHDSSLLPDIVAIFTEQLDDPADCLVAAHQILLTATPSWPPLTSRWSGGDGSPGEKLLIPSAEVSAFLTHLHDIIPFDENEQLERTFSPPEALVLAGVLAKRAHELTMVSISLSNENIEDIDSGLLVSLSI